jgi:hypothetical protein
VRALGGNFQMNKVYRVIFNVKKGCYTVVSEIAKRTGKSSSVLKSSTVTAATLAVLITLGGILLMQRIMSILVELKEASLHLLQKACSVVLKNLILIARV